MARRVQRLDPAGPLKGDTVLAHRDVEGCSMVLGAMGGIVQGEFRVGRWSTTWYGKFYRAQAANCVRLYGGVAWETQGAIYVAVPIKFIRKAQRIMEG